MTSARQAGAGAHLPSRARPWREERVYHDGDPFFADLLRAIAGAGKSVDLETYIFDRDALGMEVLVVLEAAAKRGVRTRLLLDGFGSAQWTYGDLAALQQAGIEARFYHPLPWQSRAFGLGRHMTLRRLILGMWKLNRRNHRKTCIIDGTVAYLGGMNVSARHLVSRVGDLAWRDTSVRVEGAGVARLAEAFELAWTHPRSLRGSRERASRIPARPSAVRLNLTERQRRASYTTLVRRVLEARTRVWIINPYFVPDVSLLRALRFAAWAGIDVRLLFPRDWDIWGFKWAVMAFYRPLLAAGARVFEYLPSVLHAKVVLIDDWATVGSTNLNHRSLLHDLEADVVLTMPETLRSIEERFVADLARSREVELGTWIRRGWWHRALQKLVLAFRRWM